LQYVSNMPVSRILPSLPPLLPLPPPTVVQCPRTTPPHHPGRRHQVPAPVLRCLLCQYPLPGPIAAGRGGRSEAVRGGQRWSSVPWLSIDNDINACCRCACRETADNEIAALTNIHHMWLSTMWGYRVIIRGEYGEHDRGKVQPNRKEHHTASYSIIQHHTASYCRMTDTFRGR